MPPKDFEETYILNGMVIFRPLTGSYLEVRNVVGNWSKNGILNHIKDTYPGWQLHSIL